jgi:hypothetical protein
MFGDPVGDGAPLMEQRKAVGFLVASALGLAAAVVSNASLAQTPQVIAPRLGAYGRLDTYCGAGQIPHDPAEIPLIGCFYLSQGHKTAATIQNHRVEVSVNEAGEEVFSVDGSYVHEINGPQAPPSHTNLPDVRPSGSGYGICENAATGYCPTDISVFARNLDKSVLFTVAECLPPDNRICVLSKKAWDFERERLHQQR